MSLQDIAPPEDIPAFRERLAKLARAWATPASGAIAPARANSWKWKSPPTPWRPASSLCMVIDSTERSKLEAQLRQVPEKMESVGQLASGIAHDFNNLLTVISGHVGMLLAENPASPRAADSLKEIAEASKRASELTRQLTTFSRKHPLHLQVADLNEIVNNVGKMLRRILGEDIALSVGPSPRPVPRPSW